MAPESEEESEKADEDIEEYRKKLLSGIQSGSSKKTKNGDQIDFDNVDWDNINSDELDSEDIDNIENNKGKKHTKNSDTPDIQFTTGFGEDIGKKLLK